MEDTIKLYYSDELRKTMLELSDEHILWRIDIDNEQELNEYYADCERERERFSKQYKTELYFCGRSGRHVCVNDTFSNRRRYQKMVTYVKIRQKALIQKYTIQIYPLPL